jgi:hypothetical protein
MHMSVLVDIRALYWISLGLPYFFPVSNLAVDGSYRCSEPTGSSLLTSEDLTRLIFAYTIIYRRSACERQS